MCEGGTRGARGEGYGISYLGIQNAISRLLESSRMICCTYSIDSTPFSPFRKKVVIKARDYPTLGNSKEHKGRKVCIPSGWPD